EMDRRNPTGQPPPGVTFTDNRDGTATLSGNPTGSAASSTFTVIASNTVGTARQLFTLSLSRLAPVFVSPDSATFTSGLANRFTVSTTGSPTAALNVGKQTLPRGLAFQDNHDGSATLSGNPAPGSTTFTISATN